MPMLERNQVYLYDIGAVRSLYNSLQQYLILDKLGIVNTPATFKEDLDVVIRYINGLYDDDEYKAYVDRTPYEYYPNEYDRLWLLDQIYNQIEGFILLSIPEYRYRKYGIKVTYDDHRLYVVDTRRLIHVPDTIDDLFG